MNREDKKLARRWMKADPFKRNSLLKQIEQRYFPALKVFLYNTGGLSLDDVEDILQETLILLNKNAQSYNDHYAFSTWLYRIARNQAANYRRKQREISMPDRVTDRLVSAEMETEDFLLRKEEIRFIQQFLQQCSPREREAAFLYYYRELKQKEIAHVMDIAEGTVKALLSRVRQKLKEAWNEEME